MQLNRRDFLYSALILAGCKEGDYAYEASAEPLSDPRKILDLPNGFEYDVIASAGETMDDGLLGPARPDGMAAFPTRDGRIVLIRNHENMVTQSAYGPFGEKLDRLARVPKEFIYDFGEGITPGNGGTTSIVYDPASRRVDSVFLSLAGTELNCAGGPTPWGTWLSCEECCYDYILAMSRSARREKAHGYVFEVRSEARELEPPRCLPALGRFAHEAAAVDPDSGIVYLTEDQKDSLLYRLKPAESGRLEKGGRFQALAFDDRQIRDTANRTGSRELELRRWYPMRWIDLRGADSAVDDLRHRGAELGAAQFVRGEGITYKDGELYFTCTEGGPDAVGQVFRYRISNDRDGDSGELMLLVESERDSIMQGGDNISVAPWGDLIVCEDRGLSSGLVGITPAGEVYRIARNSYTASELAGVCFAPDGATMFVNIQENGQTLAIRGPFEKLAG